MTTPPLPCSWPGPGFGISRCGITSLLAVALVPRRVHAAAYSPSGKCSAEVVFHDSGRGLAGGAEAFVLGPATAWKDDDDDDDDDDDNDDDDDDDDDRRRRRRFRRATKHDEELQRRG